MTPAEAEFDVTDESLVSALLASFAGPVAARGVSISSQPEVAVFLTSVGTLRTRPS